MKFLTKDELATVCGSRELVRRIYKVALVTITLLDVNNRLSMDVVLEQLTKDSIHCYVSKNLKMKDEHRDNTSSKVLQFLSQADELDVKERILVANLCKAGVSVP